MPKDRGTNSNTHDDDIAIIGMSCIFPAADGPVPFWSNIINGVSAIGEPLPDWDAQRYRDAGAIPTAAGGFLRDLFRFDAAELGVMPASIDGGEPDQFLALRVAREALADAGYLGSGFDHTRTGIILGHSTYLHRGSASIVQHGIVIDQTVGMLRQLFPALDDDAAREIGIALRAQLPPFNSDIAPGLVPNVMTGRIANRLDLHGPNYLIDAACASSLLAISAAMEELRSGRSDLMLSGSVNASLPAEVYMLFSHLGALSRRSHVRPFAADADGTLLGEGLGIIVLKRLADATAAGDRIYAVIKAVGQSSDGKGLGLLAPNRDGEALAMTRAYEQAGLSPDTIGLIEAHGTGIPLGDITEIAALRSLFGERRDLPDCAIGSVKSMIGHCIPAAGIAGLIKAVLALYYRILPPTLCGEVNAKLELERTPLYVNTEARPWIQGPERIRRAAVSAFGFGGINSHVILEEPPQEQSPTRLPRWTCELAVFAGETTDTLIAELDAVVAAHATGRLTEVSLASLAKGFAERATNGRLRLAIVATDVGDLMAKCAQAAARLRGQPQVRIQSRSGVFYAPERQEGLLAFVFPGEGAQYQGMLADVLMAFPEARAWFDFWDGLFADTEGPRRSACVFPPPTTLDETTQAALKTRLFGIEVGSEAMFIATQALLAVLATLDLKPDAVVGHSNGENSALLAAGALTCRDRTELGEHIRKLNRAYRGIGDGSHTTGGSLLTVGAVARERVLALADGADVHLALDNCHHQSVLYGPRPLMEALARQLGQEGGLCAFLPFDRPYHTPLFAASAQALAAMYDDMRFGSPAVPIYSCATTQPMPDDERDIRRLALSQWSSRVRFTETIERMYADGIRYFVEVGPSSNLTGFIDDILRGRDALAVALDNQRRSSLTQLLTALARLWVRGRDFNVAALFAGRGLTAVHPDAADAGRGRRRVYANTLPYLRLPAEDVDKLRTRIDAMRLPSPPVMSPAVDFAGELPAPIDKPLAPATDDPAAVTAAVAEHALGGYFSLMREFLATQERMVGRLIAATGDEAVDGDVAGLPFVQRILKHDDQHVVALCELSVAEDAFLRHHVLYASEVSDLDPALSGLSVVPLAVSMEMAAEIASVVARHPVLSGFENVRTYDWIALDRGSRSLTLTAKRRTDVSGEVDGAERITAVITDGPARLFETEVIFHAAPVAVPPTLPDLIVRRPSVWRGEELYDSGMFHGPLFQSIGGLEAWDETGIDAILADTPLDGFFVEGERPRLFLNPALLDAIGQVSAFWLAQDLGTDFSTFPSRIARIELGDAWREDTGGAVLKGRITMERSGGDAGTRYLDGDYECVSADGTVLFRATGWQDLFFPIPSRLFIARYRPREGWYGDDCTALFPQIPAGVLVCSVPAFPPRLLDDSGGIWKRILAHTVLSRAERQTWEGLSPNPQRRTDWLMGRIALKEVVRLWIHRHHGVLVMPADIEIDTDGGGKPFVVARGLEAFTPLPQVSVAHADGAAVAIAAPSDVPVGIDLEPLGRVDSDDVLTGAFTAEERCLLDGGGDGDVIRAWCAKEAAAKCLGTSLKGRPQAFALSRFSVQQPTAPALVSAFGHQITIAFAQWGNAVLAVAANALG